MDTINYFGVILIITAAITIPCWIVIAIKRKGVSLIQKRYDKQIKEAGRKMELISQSIDKTFKSLAHFVVILVVVGISIFIIIKVFSSFAEFLRPKSWNLMVCKSTMNNGTECYDTSYILKGYKTQSDCMEKGMQLAKKEGFECGKNCRDYDSCKGQEDCIQVCDIICNKVGCK
ncbi:MAG: hypothetical protein ABIG91_00320 [Patescibacteria group bacterium]